MLSEAEKKSGIDAATVGMWISPGIGNAYPELISLLDTLYHDRVAKLPWVPMDWYAKVSAVQNADRTNLVRPLPALGAGSALLSNVPDWIKDQPRREAWQAIVDRSNEIIGNYAKGQADLARPQLEKLYADAAFWNSPMMVAASNVQEALIAAPSAIGGAAGKLVSGLFGSFLKYGWWVLALGVIGYVVWANRGSMAKAAPGVARKMAKKAASVVKEATA